MALINYVEPVDPSGMIVAFGSVILMGAFGYLIYKLITPIINLLETYYRREVKHEIFEESFLDEIAMEKGIDLNKKLAERKMFDNNMKRKSFRKRIEDEMYNKMFGDDKKKKHEVINNN
jgi:hypothetical protein